MPNKKFPINCQFLLLVRIKFLLFDNDFWISIDRKALKVHGEMIKHLCGCSTTHILHRVGPRERDLLLIKKDEKDGEKKEIRKSTSNHSYLTPLANEPWRPTWPKVTDLCQFWFCFDITLFIIMESVTRSAKCFSCLNSFSLSDSSFLYTRTWSVNSLQKKTRFTRPTDKGFV